MKTLPADSVIMYEQTFIYDSWKRQEAFLIDSASDFSSHHSSFSILKKKKMSVFGSPPCYYSATLRSIVGALVLVIFVLLLAFLQEFKSLCEKWSPENVHNVSIVWNDIELVEQRRVGQCYFTVITSRCDRQVLFIYHKWCFSSAHTLKRLIKTWSQTCCLHPWTHNHP